MNLSIFNTANLFESATDLFRQLGITLNSNTKEPLPVRDLLKQHFRETEIFKAIDKTFFIGIIDDSVFRETGLFDENYSYKQALQQADKSYEGLMLFALELKRQPTRTEISELTRAFNRISQKMPVALVLKYKLKIENEEAISITISERFKYKQNWRQGEKAGKVIILRDIHTQTTHTGHLRILQDLVKPVAVTNYAQLHEHWLQVLDVNLLNKKFFQELANWYFWAMDNVQFPTDIKLHDDKKKDEELRNATNLIRLITRIIFIWFIKEKKLVPANLFRKDFLSKIVKDFAKNKKSENYYQAILQNLFFGTLNQNMKDRKFAESHSGFVKSDQTIRNLYRFPDKFLIDENEVKKLFKDIPFLNGGLFDCLDKTNEETKKEVFVDGFTRDEKHQASVPDYLFFGEETEVDLNEIYATKNKKYKVKGLVNLLESYKFTVAENTPIEEEIALDPELLGKVFENLLASYNPETQTTARKQTGSFYTPREIVNYMVDESLMEYLKQKCNGFPDLENRLRDLFSYSENPNPFNEKETKILIKAINNCKMLDLACGSGAFPMGMLHKMVHILTKLDPDNSKWKAEQEEKIIGDKINELEKDKNAIEGLSDAAVKEKARKAVDERLKEVKEIFESENNFDDYSRKLFLIENCIYGIDIQPIAVQITKLRFFISLIVDQNKQEDKENFGIRSLPNLETKFVAANTLIGLDRPTGFDFRNKTIVELEQKLKDNRHKHFSAKSRKEKIDNSNEDKALRKKIAIEIINEYAIYEKSINKQIDEQNNLLNLSKNAKIRDVEKARFEKARIDIENKIKKLQSALVDKSIIDDTADKISSFDIFDTTQSAPFFESEWMFGLTDGFDIVIGNPPYVEAKKLKDVSQTLRKFYSTYSGTADLYVYFYENGVRHLKENGTLIFITSNKFIKTSYGENLRKYFTGFRINEIVDFTDVHVFEALVASCIFSISRNKVADNKIRIAFANDTLTDFSDVATFVDQNKFYLSQNGLSEKIWQLENETNLALKEKIESGSITLLNTGTVKIFRGVTTGYNPAFIIDDEKRKELLKEDKANKSIIKPMLQGRNIRKWVYNKTSDFLIFTRKGIDIKEFPSIKKHLNNFKQQLEPGVGRKPGSYNWYEIQDNTAYYPEFEKEKIIWGLTSDKWTFAYDNEKNFLPSNGYILTSSVIPIKYLMALLNSKLMEFYFGYIGIMTAGGAFTLKYETVIEFPVKNISLSDQKPFITLVDKILSAKEKNHEADTSKLEKQLDEIVYKLYELTEEEIKTIENKK